MEKKKHEDVDRQQKQMHSIYDLQQQSNISAKVTLFETQESSIVGNAVGLHIQVHGILGVSAY